MADDKNIFSSAQRRKTTAECLNLNIKNRILHHHDRPLDDILLEPQIMIIESVGIKELTMTHREMAGLVPVYFQVSLYICSLIYISMYQSVLSLSFISMIKQGNITFLKPMFDMRRILYCVLADGSVLARLIDSLVRCQQRRKIVCYCYAKLRTRMCAFNSLPPTIFAK